MKKKLMVIAALLVMALLLASCSSKGNKEFTAKDIEGRWKVDYDASTTSIDDPSGLHGFMVSARADDSAVVVFKDGQITVEWVAQDGKKTASLGSYEVKEGSVFINGFSTEPKLEGNKLILSQKTPIEGGVYVHVDDEPVTVTPQPTQNGNEVILTQPPMRETIMALVKQ